MMTEEDISRVRYPREVDLGVNLPDNEYSAEVIPFHPLRAPSPRRPRAQEAARRRVLLSPGMTRRAVFLLKALGLAIALSPWVFLAAVFYSTN